MKTYCKESRKEDILHTVNGRKANWIDHILRRNCIVKHVIEGEIKVVGSRGRRRSSYWMTLQKREDT
jgi:hypothetical protein